MKIYYIENNYDFIMQDIARGQGEYLDGLVRIYGCHQSQGPRIKSAARDNLGKLLDGQAPQSFLNTMNDLVKDCSNSPSV